VLHHLLPLLGFYIGYWASDVVWPIIFLALLSILYVLISVCGPIVIVVSRGLGSYICVFYGVAFGVLQVIVRVLVLPFRMSVRGRDVNKHTPYKTARIAREVGDSRGDLLYVLSCFFF
jgi:bacteriorhodopsin